MIQEFSFVSKISLFCTIIQIQDIFARKVKIFGIRSLSRFLPTFVNIKYINKIITQTPCFMNTTSDLFLSTFVYNTTRIKNVSLKHNILHFILRIKQ